MNRHIKSFLTFTGGAAVGLIFGGAGVVAAELNSESVRHALKKVFYDWVGDTLFYEKKDSSHQKVSYQSYYDNRRQSKDKSMFIPFTEAVYMFRSDAEALLDALEGFVSDYGVVTLTDYYETTGLVDKCTFQTSLYGWTKNDICGVKIEKRCRSGYDEYYVALPMPKKLPQ